MRDFQFVPRSHFHPSLWSCLPHSSLNHPGHWGCVQLPQLFLSPSKEKAPLRFCPQILPIQPTCQMFESCITTAARQALHNYTAEFSNITNSLKVLCVCVCVRETTKQSSQGVEWQPLARRSASDWLDMFRAIE